MPGSDADADGPPRSASTRAPAGTPGLPSGEQPRSCTRSPVRSGIAPGSTIRGILAGASGRGLGITALFVGDSGTGKTLAAEVLANELGSTSTASTCSRSSANTSARPRRTCGGLRRRRGQRRDPAVRRSRCAVRQAQRSQGQPRPLRQHRGQLPAAAHGGVSRACDPHHQPQGRARPRRSCGGCASSCSSRSRTREQRELIWRASSRGDPDARARLAQARAAQRRRRQHPQHRAERRLSRRRGRQPVAMPHLRQAALGECLKL